ncbi:threonine synthase [Alicyclobacillus cycloheptanicus]|uniref:Threonine synthase n=1 Tax=Alicyclobacillus cycloheptanicus TaxID=1457 RepID=A0ABT9XIE6_9BACL|nr:threonine synthase [Alicyclobacillus cycloheptanicus]MDQ0190088.1 threonine synthase [Alicyclobacillus cycloheptanicus]WDM02064.1 threonine synthase [Alicyclobacillus cycloheptanicus]
MNNRTNSWITLDRSLAYEHLEWTNIDGLKEAAIVAQVNQKTERWSGLLHHYGEWLPLTERTPRLSLCEGNTPLIFSERLSERVNASVYLKYEGANPTGSFKDRGMVLAVAKAKEEGSNTVICASTGNTSASAAAYAARAGMRAIILIPDGYVALGKLAQAMMYGAHIIAIRGNFDEALQLVRDMSDRFPITVVNSINPYRLDGQQTAAFEVCDALGAPPDVLCIPVGNAGNISAYWKGFQAYQRGGKTDRSPRMFGFEAEGAAAIVKGHPIEHPETFATAIRIGKPASAHLAVAAARDSGGAIRSVTDEQIAQAYRWIASEGVLAEPASAASVAGLMCLADAGEIERGQTVVCVLTGNGLKDPDSAMKHSDSAAQVVDATADAVAQLLEGMQ